MAIILVGIEVRSARRVRIQFSTTLAAGAFTSTAYYAVTCTDGAGPVTNVQAALAVSGLPASVELVLDADIVDGGAYFFTGTAVPAADASTYTGSTAFRKGQPLVFKPNAEPLTLDADSYTYGVDLVWSGDDFVEGADGDLTMIAGLANVHEANQRRTRADGLPWNEPYGGHLNPLVGSAAASQGTARGSATAGLLQDPRNQAVKTTVIYDDVNAPDTVILEIQAILVGGRKPPAFTQAVVPSNAK